MTKEKLFLVTCTDKGLAEAIAREVKSRAKQEEVRKNANLNGLGDIDIGEWYK